MRITQKHHSSNRIRAVLLVIIVTAGIGASAVFLMPRHAPSKVVPPAGLAQETPGTPQFSFSGTPGWHRGPVDKVSLAVFSDDNSCWTYIHHKAGTIDAAAALQKIETGQVSNGYTVTPGDTLALTLQTTVGEKKYELHQFGVSGVGSNGAPYGGQEYGYFTLADGYAKIEGYCHTVEQLPSITPALQVLKFDASK